MAHAPQLTPEIERTLARYLQIQQEERQLQTEKARLREQLASHLGGATGGRLAWHPTVEGEPVTVYYRTDMQVAYDEALLEERLGERYPSILAPDVRKLRCHLDRVEPLVQPILTLVGTPERERVRQAIEQGVVRKEDFRDAYEKRERVYISVRREPGSPRVGETDETW